MCASESACVSANPNLLSQLFSLLNPNSEKDKTKAMLHLCLSAIKNQNNVLVNTIPGVPGKELKKLNSMLNDALNHLENI
jgi:hypothetical protein